jgi:hypothetical protein
MPDELSRDEYLRALGAKYIREHEEKKDREERAKRRRADELRPIWAERYGRPPGTAEQGYWTPMTEQERFLAEERRRADRERSKLDPNAWE